MHLLTYIYHYHDKSQNYSFYDLIVTKARGKSGPLFHFDVHDDVRMTIDTRIEKDEVGAWAWVGRSEAICRCAVCGRTVSWPHVPTPLPPPSHSPTQQSHPGKVVDRKWYERNKHIFPASRWEVYDPKVERGGYTVHGQEVVKKK